jgi:hypothetical protein
MIGFNKKVSSIFSEIEGNIKVIWVALIVVEIEGVLSLHARV